MAFRLKNTERQTKAKLRERLAEAFNRIEAAKSEVEHSLEITMEPLKDAIEDYNELLNEAKEFANEIGTDRRGEFDDKSDTWQEGDRGQTASEWLGTWEDYAPDELEVPELSLDFDPSDEAGDALDALEDEAPL